MKNRFDESVNISIHPVIYSLIQGGKKLQENKRHFFGIITGNVGDGKSTLALLMSALWEHLHNRRTSFENICWTTEKFVEKTDREDNKTFCIHWDEAIQGATARNMAITSEGEMLKVALVTKRFKEHFYILIVDEIEEYSWKLIKMCNFWAHCHTIDTKRGFFKMWIDKKKIKDIYRSFKWSKKDWSLITTKPDFTGTFLDYFNTFLDPQEYNKRKLEETQQVFSKNKKKKENKNFNLPQFFEKK